jgi:hypothetical protein
MADRPQVWYVYGVVPASLPVTRAPAGLDDTSVESIHDAEVAAVVSRLDGAQYAPELVEGGTADMEWLAPRAVAHDRVLTWVSDRGPVVPLPMFSLFSSVGAVRSMLQTQRAQLGAALERVADGREYVLRVYRLDDELQAVAAEMSPRLAELEGAAASASPGQRYLIERKLDAERKTELRAIGARVARDVIDALRPSAIDAVESRPEQHQGSQASEHPLVLDAAFLISPTGLEDFRRALTTLVERHGSRGFRFDFTGPWPPYHFVQTSTEARPRDT